MQSLPWREEYCGTFYQRKGSTIPLKWHTSGLYEALPDLPFPQHISNNGNTTDSKGYVLYISFVISLAWIYGEPHWCKDKVKGRGERMEERRQEGCSVFLLHYWGWVLGSLRHVGILNHLHPANVSSHLALLPSAPFLHFSMKSPPPHFYISPGLSSIIVGDKGTFPMLSWPEPDGYG